MRLFDDLQRSDSSAARHSEPAFPFLNRSARTEFARVRDVLEVWFSRYPPSEQAALASRFRSQDDIPHESAFFELFLHELLLRLGCEVTVHPGANAKKSKRPDFLVKSDSGTFYLEATLASEASNEDRAAQARENVVYDALDRLDSPDFFIGMNLRGAPKTPPSAKSIRTFLADRLTGLDPDDVSRLYRLGGEKAFPRWSYQHDGWTIEFFPIPKSLGARGKPGIRPVGSRSYAIWDKTASAIRNAILSKAGKYGNLEAPYVIAVNVLPHGAQRDDIMEALFGDEQMVIHPTESGPEEGGMSRKLNGAWTSPTGPRYTRVSAALLCGGVLPWTILRAPVCLYHNPWAKHPYESPLTRLAQAIPQGDRMHWEEGEALHSVLGLSENWPWED